MWVRNPAEKEESVFKVLNINFVTNTPTGKLKQTMLAAVAEFEQEMLLERQAEGIRTEKAKVSLRDGSRLPGRRVESG